MENLQKYSRGETMGKIGKILKKKKTIFILLAVVVGIAGFSAMKNGSKSGADAYMEEQAAITDMGESLSYEGFISSGKSQEVHAQNVTKIKKINVKVGDSVKIGDILAVYDEGNTGDTLASAQASVETSGINLKTAQSNLERMTSLYEVGGISAEEYEKAKNEVATARAQAKQASAAYSSAADNVSDLVVKAEINGTVVSVDGKEGQSVTSGTKILEIASYDDLEVDITIDEYDKKLLKEGMKATVKMNSTEEVVEGVVSEISKKADVENGVAYFKGKIKLENADFLSIGVSVEATVFTTEQRKALAVPLTAVKTREDGSNFVYGKEMKEIDVKVGKSTKNSTEILSGLKEGDTVMVPLKEDDWEKVRYGGYEE